MRENAYSLFELIIYLSLFSFIAMLFLGVISRTQLRLMKSAYKQEILLRQVLAIDLLRRDLISASTLSPEWVEQEGIFKKITLTSKNQQQEVSVCWFISKNGLMRAQGKYNFAKHEWNSKSECLVCKTIKQINFILVKSDLEGFCFGVWVLYKGEGFDQEKRAFVRFRNRIIK